MRKACVVVMMCGPRTPEGFPSTHRILRAIQVAKDSRCRLIIAGEGERTEGSSLTSSEVDFYASMAAEEGVLAYCAYSPKGAQANTKTNARAIAERLAGMGGVREIYLVTDTYHMPRALFLLNHAIKLFVVDAIKITEVAVVPTRKPSTAVYAHEVNELSQLKDKTIEQIFLA